MIYTELKGELMCHCLKSAEAEIGFEPTGEREQLRPVLTSYPYGWEFRNGHVLCPTCAKANGDDAEKVRGAIRLKTDKERLRAEEEMKKAGGRGSSDYAFWEGYTRALAAVEGLFWVSNKENVQAEQKQKGAG